MENEKMIKHLELIQTVVARLSTHSFRLKTLTIVQVAAVLLAFSSSEDSLLLVLAPVAAILLWILDARFLRDERAYRRLYDGVRQLPDNEVDFAMDVAGLRGSVLRAALSGTLAPFYLLLIGSSAFAAIYLGKWA